MTAPVRPTSQIEQTVGGFRRILQTTPGFPLTPNYGQHGMDLRFVLVGDLGATQFLMFTDWVPGKVGRPHGAPSRSGGCFPMAADLGYHWKANPHGDDADWGRMDQCDWFEGGCWANASGLNAEPVMQRFIAEGLDAVWSELESYYRDVAGWRPDGGERPACSYPLPHPAHHFQLPDEDRDGEFGPMRDCAGVPDGGEGGNLTGGEAS